MVRHDKDDMRRAFQVGTPMFEGLVDCKEFLVVDFVVELCKEHCLGGGKRLRGDCCLWVSPATGWW